VSASNEGSSHYRFASRASARERRVALTPPDVRRLANKSGFLVERGAGSEAGFSDAEYATAGARVTNMEEVLAQARSLSKSGLPTARFFFVRGHCSCRWGAEMKLWHRYCGKNRSCTSDSSVCHAAPAPKAWMSCPLRPPLRDMPPYWKGASARCVASHFITAAVPSSRRG